jgi:hypothetical protein
MLPRHTLQAAPLWQWLKRVLVGLSLKAAAEKARLAFALETVYQWGRKLRRGLERWRTFLCREQKPPLSAQSDPLLQTLEHFKLVFPHSHCPLAAFQLHFQSPLLD